MLVNTISKLTKFPHLLDFHTISGTPVGGFDGTYKIKHMAVCTFLLLPQVYQWSGLVAPHWGNVNLLTTRSVKLTVGMREEQSGEGPELHNVLRANDERSLDRLPEGCSGAATMGLVKT